MGKFGILYLSVQYLEMLVASAISKMRFYCRYEVSGSPNLAERDGVKVILGTGSCTHKICMEPKSFCGADKMTIELTTLNL